MLWSTSKYIQNHYKSELLKKENQWNKEGARRYLWNSSGANVSPDKNNYLYVGMPGSQTVDNAALIIFNDAPNVHPALQKQILASIHEGADLLILSGLFSLGKGGFRNSVLEKALPVVLTDNAWSFSGDGKTEYSLQTKNGFQWDPKGKVLFNFYDLQPAEGSEILMTASEPGWFGRKDIPVLLRKKFGKGHVYVLTGTACGPHTENSFWKGDFLKELLDLIHASRGK